MQIELACRDYASGWLSFAQAARLAARDQYAFGVELGERSIPRQYGLTEAQEDIAHGWSPEEIHFQHAHLSLAQIHAALGYYYDHKDELDAQV